MAKESKEKVFLQEIASVEEVVEEEPELLVEEEEEPEGKMNKQEFLDSIGQGKRPGSQLAITKWEEYLGI